MPTSNPGPQSGKEQVTPLALPNKLLGRFLPIGKLLELYERANHPEGVPIFESILEQMGVTTVVEPEDMKRIPAKGPVVVVCNHPFGMLDGVIIGALLSRVRPDVRIMTNSLLSGLPEVARQCIFVNPFGGKEAAIMNRKGLREGITWLKNGGMLAIFPAGEVSHWKFRNGKICDPKWSETVARLIRITNATTVPVFFKGKNSISFHALGFVHPRLRTVRLPQEFLKSQGKRVEVRIGCPVPPSVMQEMPDDRDATRYLRWRTYLLQHRGESKEGHHLFHTHGTKKVVEPLALEACNPAIAAEVENLPIEQRLGESRELAVFIAEARQIPNTLKEIGRLREVTFRAVGEGTGKEIDLDEFDEYYQHLFVWNKNKQELVGAYRVGRISEILAKRGVKGLYTSTLFKYDPQLFEKIGPSVELGRSFVRIEYQKQYGPLLLLWKGISKYVSRHPDAPVLFGAVSISSKYNRASRELLVRFYELQRRSHGLAKLIEPRRPFKRERLRGFEWKSALKLLQGADAISGPIEDIESDGKSVPILIKQYLKVGGELLGFNVDRDFSDVVDGLVVVDLRKTDPEILERYMGTQELETFRKYHGLPPRRNVD